MLDGDTKILLLLETYISYTAALLNFFLIFIAINLGFLLILMRTHFFRVAIVIRTSLNDSIVLLIDSSMDVFNFCYLTKQITCK